MRDIPFKLLNQITKFNGKILRKNEVNSEILMRGLIESIFGKQGLLLIVEARVNGDGDLSSATVSLI